MSDVHARLLIREIGVIAPSNVGDAVLVLPAIAELALRFPKARLTIAGGRRAHAVFDGDPRVAVYLEFGTDEQTWRERLRVIRQLRRRRFDLLLDTRHTLLPWLLRARRRTNPCAQPPSSLTHRSDRYRWQLERLLAPMHLPTAAVLAPTQIWAFTQNEHVAVEHLWSAWHLPSSGPVIAVSPGARSDDKRWPAAQWSLVCDRLIRELHATVIVTGETAETALLDEMPRALREQLRVAIGQTTVRTLAGLLTRCDAAVTNDSAALHIASILNMPVVALFGPTDPAKYGPRSDRSTVLRRQPIADLTPDDVFAAVRALVRSPVHAA